VEANSRKKKGDTSVSSTPGAKGRDGKKGCRGPFPVPESFEKATPYAGQGVFEGRGGEEREFNRRVGSGMKLKENCFIRRGNVLTINRGQRGRSGQGGKK